MIDCKNSVGFQKTTFLPLWEEMVEAQYFSFSIRLARHLFALFTLVGSVQVILYGRGHHQTRCRFLLHLGVVPGDSRGGLKVKHSRVKQGEPTNNIYSIYIYINMYAPRFGEMFLLGEINLDLLRTEHASGSHEGWAKHVEITVVTVTALGGGSKKYAMTEKHTTLCIGNMPSLNKQKVRTKKRTIVTKQYHYLAILCDLSGMVKWLSKVKRPPTWG